MKRSPQKKEGNSLVNLSLVVPVYNEEQTIPFFLERINKVFLSKQDINLEILFVNDGSTDSTLPDLLNIQESNKKIKIIDLSRNFGKEAALAAGLQLSEGDIVVPIDVDLQDPPELIPEMIELWKEGFEVVLARRSSRKTDSWIKSRTSSWFYAVFNKISNPKLPSEVGDFRLMDRKVVNALNKLSETRRFMKGLFAWVGFKTTQIDFSREERIAGKSKFGGWKLWNFALEGLTSFSIEPLKIWTYIGISVSSITFIFGVFIFFKALITGIAVPGYASIIVAITFLGGMQLMGLGIIGEYLGRTYIESKQRPVYVVRDIYKPE